jgi:hypothetical protein
MFKEILYLSFFTTVIISCQKDIRFDQAGSELPASSTPTTDCGQLRTQTPGGWGSTPRGNNPGRYLHSNFADAFPVGLTIGCAGGGSVTVTSAQAITNLLPTGGKAATLNAELNNPTGVKNVLVGHLIALSLSSGFDFNDPDFGSSTTRLSEMIIGSGVFSGMTVGAFIEIANNVIGGCSDAYSIQDVLSTASAINESYVDGTRSSSFLKCPDAGPR